MMDRTVIESGSIRIDRASTRIHPGSISNRCSIRDREALTRDRPGINTDIL
jgi:hypothetical protein